MGQHDFCRLDGSTVECRARPRRSGFNTWLQHYDAHSTPVHLLVPLAGQSWLAGHPPILRNRACGFPPTRLPLLGSSSGVSRVTNGVWLSEQSMLPRRKAWDSGCWSSRFRPRPGRFPLEQDRAARPCRMQPLRGGARIGRRIGVANHLGAMGWMRSVMLRPKLTPGSSRLGAHLVPAFAGGRVLLDASAILAHDAVAGLEPGQPGSRNPWPGCRLCRSGFSGCR